jgi:class 3 adenylate cyclase
MKAQAKGFATPDHVQELPGFRVESVAVGDATVGYCRFAPGWQWSTDMAPILRAPSCPMRHLGYCVSGTMHVVMDDGQELEITPHTVFEIPPGHDKWVVGDEPWVAVEWGGTQRASRAAAAETSARTLATVLFTDIVGSTSLAAQIGDAAWRDRLAAHNNALREVLNVHRGREVTTTGDGVLAVFDSPARAVRCAVGLVRAAGRLDLQIRVGIHTGEIEWVGDDVRGIAVHAAARVMAVAGPDEILVSATTAALLEGSGLQLADAGIHELKGIPGPRQLFRLTDEGAGSG